MEEINSDGRIVRPPMKRTEKGEGQMSGHPDHAPNGYTFRIRGNTALHNGKSHWRDCLTVILDRHQALDLLAELATALQRGTQEIWIGQCGWLEQDKVGSWPFAENGEGNRDKAEDAK